MKREPTASAGVKPQEDKDAPERPVYPLASDAEIASLLLRLWRAVSPEPELLLRRSDAAGNRYLATRTRGSAPTVLFDPSFYVAQLPNFLRHTVDPLLHYLQAGWSLGLSPHPAFDNAFVAEQLGITSWTTPPLLVYFETADEISPHPLFDVDVYARHVRIDSTRYARLFEMFLDSWPSARAPFSHLFSIRYYERLEPAVRFGKLNPLLHYLSAEIARRRDANPMIHNRWYDTTYPAKPGQPKDPLIRFARMGLREGHLPNPFAPKELRLEESDSYVPPDVILQYIDARSSDELLFQSTIDQSAPKIPTANPQFPESPQMRGAEVVAKVVSRAAAALPSQRPVTAQSSAQAAD